ncbi:MAG: DUF6370 family protein [Verrucomicrobiota bacterium]
MKRSIIAAFVVASLAIVLNSRAADEKTITGDGMCAKCELKEAKSCQNAVKVKEGGKTVTYYLVHNDVSKKFHGKVCTSTEKVKVTGTVKEVDGKMELTPTKIDLAEK